MERRTEMFINTLEFIVMSPIIKAGARNSSSREEKVKNCLYKNWRRKGWSGNTTQIRMTASRKGNFAFYIIHSV